MAELGKLVAGITHEVASPIGTMMLSVDHILAETAIVQAALEQNKLDKKMFVKFLAILDEGLSLCQRNSLRASELMTSFKPVAVDQCSRKLIEFSLSKYIEDILLTLRPELKNSPHKVRVNIDDGITINSYPGALSQIITNLINNSCGMAFKVKGAQG